MGERSNQWLFTWKNVPFEAGKIEAVAYTYDKSDKKSKDAKTKKETSRYAIETAGKPHHIKLTSIQNPKGFKADGADMALIQVEVVDSRADAVHSTTEPSTSTIRAKWNGLADWQLLTRKPKRHLQPRIRASW